MSFVIRIYHDSAQTLRAEEQRVHRYLHSRCRNFYLQMHLSIAAGKKLAVPVRHVNFRQQCSCIGIDGLRSANYFSLKILARILGQLEKSAESDTNRWRIHFRHVHVDADRIRLRKREKLLLRAAITRINERSNVDITASDDAAERRINVFERFQLLEAADIGGGGLNRGG